MSLIAWYKLQGDVLDSSGNNYHATAYGSPAYTIGKLGTAMNFDGVDDYFLIPKDVSARLLGDNFTFSCWLKPEFPDTSGVILLPNTLGHDSFIKVSNTGVNISAVSVADGPGLNNGDIYGLNKSMYSHYTVVKEGRSFKQYLDGKLIKKSVSPYSVGAWTGEWYVGVRGTVGTLRYVGTIEDVRIYDEALSDKEIKEISMAKLLHYKFDTPKGNTTSLCTHGHFDSLAFSFGVSGGTVTVNLLTGEGYEGRNAVYLKKSAGSGTGDWQIAWTGGFPTSVSAGETFYMSCKYKKETPDTYFNIGDWEMSVNGQMPGWTPLYNYYIGDGWFQLVCSRKFTSAVGVGFIYGLNSITPNKWIKICDFQLERYAPTPFVIGTRASDRIIDYSDWGNHSEPLTQTNQPMWTRDSSLGEGCYDFSPGQYIYADKTYLRPSDTITLIARVKLKSYLTDTHNTVITLASAYYLSVYNGYVESFAYGRNNSIYYVADNKKLDLNTWYHIATVITRTQTLIYIDGVLIKSFTNDLSDNIQNVVNTYQVSLGTIYPTLTYAGNLCIDDVRMYATALSAEDILNIYKCRGSLGDKGDLHLNTIKTRSNLISKIQTALENKTFGNGLGYYPQSNCINTLTNNGFRIYRPANLLYPEAGNTMWGGLVLVIPEGTFIAGRKYKLKLQYKGKSTNATQIFGAYMAAWGGYGALGNFTGITKIKTTDNITASGFNTESWHDIEITLEPTIANMYKAAVNTGQGNDTSITGNMYYLLNEFKIGFDYVNTGALGTDMYLKNFRLYDITDESGEISIVDNKGISHIDNFSEVGITDGLIAYYPLKKDFKDYSGNGYHGTAYGTPALTDGINQKCYLFDGVDDYAEMASMMSPTTDITFSVWCKHTSVTGGICMLGGHGNTAYAGYWLGVLHDTNKYVFSLGNNLDTIDIIQLDTNKEYDLSEWHHVTGVFDGVKKLKTIYIDGVKDIEVSTNASGINYDILTTDNIKYFKIGCNNKNDTDRYFQGKIQDVRIYDRPLGPDEIAINYEMSRPDYLDIGTANLVASLPLNNTTITDIGPYNLAVTSSNLTAVGEGLDDSACVFDGSTNWIQYNSIIPKLVGYSFSVSCFVYVSDNSTQRAFWVINNNVTVDNVVGLGINTNGYLNLGWTTGQTTVHSNRLLNRWTHLTFIYDATGVGNIHLYIDGEFSYSIPMAFNLSVTNDKFNIGQDSDGAVLSDFFAGRMQDFRVYNKVLSQDEITILANKYKNKKPKMKVASDGTVYINKVKEV